jgi:soluble lytic murein transglycosylase
MGFFRSATAVLTYIAVIIVGCHSAPLKPPAPTNFAVNTTWLKDYRKAREMQSTDRAKSCSMFKKLSDERKFPGKQVALLHAWEICEGDQRPKVDREELPPYLRDMSLEIALAQSAKDGDKSAEMLLALEKSKQRMPQAEKIKWTSLALTRARELNDEAKVNEYTKRLYRIAPRLNPHPPESRYLAVATDFRLSRQFEKARTYYNKILSGENFDMKEKVAAWKGIRMSYKNARNDESHVSAAKELAEYLKAAQKTMPKSGFIRNAYYDAQIYLGRALWTLHRTTAARMVFDRVEKRTKGRLPVAELYWLKGRMAEEAGDLKEVSRYMEAALKEKNNDPDLRDKILWYSAWNERRQKNYQRASELLNDLSNQAENDFTKTRALFWLGMTYNDLKQADKAKATFEKVMDQDPLGYYGLLAHREAGADIAFKQKSYREFDDRDLPLDTELAEWLIVLEERDALIPLLEDASQALRKQKNQPSEGWIALFRYYAKGNLYAKLYEILNGMPMEQRKAIVELQPDFLFPQPWKEDVRMAALETGVDESLIYAIIRQESAFDPHARSLADAFGLMQILPEIAEPTAKELKVPYAQMEDLYDPKTNITIGAAHVRDLLKRHNNQFILAVASYNASEKAIKNWMKTRYRGDSLEFIEEIPYEETRVYVRLVMRNLIFYSLLKSRSASISFPSWVLKLDPS